MEPHVVALAQILLVVGTFTASMVALALIVRVSWRRTNPERIASPSVVPMIDDNRFARLEDAVDSIAIEVERIAEAQRFSAKLLSERASERVGGGSGSAAPGNSGEGR